GRTSATACFLHRAGCATARGAAHAAR
ncbi:MAG: hypothetical protein AVDCRST_MAG26-244, partial [uncultured Chloroflexia bacterium]